MKVLLSNDSAFDIYKQKLLGKLQRLSLKISEIDFREDAKLADVVFITTEKGAHVPLKDGKAVGGPMKGMDFSDAYEKVKDAEKSQKHRALGYGSPIPLEKISANGKNVRCKGFKHKGTASYKASNKHKADYKDMTEDEFEKHAQDLLEKACDENIRGYKMKDGSICRFNWQTGEYAKGYPGGNLRSCFFPRSMQNKEGPVDLGYARRYFLRMKEDEAYED